MDHSFDTNLEWILTNRHASQSVNHLYLSEANYSINQTNRHANVIATPFFYRPINSD